VVCIGPLLALLDLQKLLACFIWISSWSLVPLVGSDKITPLPLKHLSFQVSVWGMCSFKPMAGLVASLGPSHGCWRVTLGLELLLCPSPAPAAELLQCWGSAAMPLAPDGEGNRHQTEGGVCWAHSTDPRV